MGTDQRLVILGFAAVLLIGLAAWILFRVRVSPEEKEKRRRLMICRIGRMTDGMLTDYDGDTLYYSYSVMGVEYAAAQDAGTLAEFLPDDRNSVVGPVTLKYSTRNPANSIIICEGWSGLRQRREPPILATGGTQAK